jgi:PPP family 3-phenylpropionic acid transporter
VGLDCFVIGSALTGKLVSLFDYRAILLMLSLGVASMLLGMLLKPSVMPQGVAPAGRGRGGGLADAGAAKLALSRLRLSAAGAHAAYYGFSAIYWQEAGYSASAVGYLWSLAWWRKW